MTPIPRLTCVSLYVEGWRDVVILSHGRKWLRGFTAATLEPVKVPSEGARPWFEILPYSRTRLARRLRANAKLYPHSKAIAAAIAELGRPSSRGKSAL